jgi:hypothetical protein
MAGVVTPASQLAGFIVGFGARAGAIATGFSLPAYRSRPGRNYGDAR